MQDHFRTAAVRRLAECFWQNTSAARIDLQPKRPAPQHSSPMLSALIRIPSSETLGSQRLPICQVNSPFRSAPAIYAARSAAVASAFFSTQISSFRGTNLNRAHPALREPLAAPASAILLFAYHYFSGGPPVDSVCVGAVIFLTTFQRVGNFNDACFLVIF